MTTAMENIMIELEQGAEDVPYIVGDDSLVEAALTANARGIEVSERHAPLPNPRVELSDEGLADCLNTWASSTVSSISALEWSQKPPRHTIGKGLMSLLVVKETSEGAADTLSTQWVHWDNPITYQGRLTELDSDSGIIYRFHCACQRHDDTDALNPY